MAHLQGGKVCGTHTTVTDTAHGFLAGHVLPMKEVTGVSVGRISKTNGGQLGAKFVPEAKRIRAKIRSASSVQEITIYCKGQPTDQVARQLLWAWQKFLKK